MNNRFRVLPSLLLAGGAFAALVAGGFHAQARAGDAVDDAIKAFEEYVKTKPDSRGLRNQIAELALKKDPRVAKALRPLLHHEDETVVIAVARNIGKQGDPGMVGLLKSMADRKDMDETPRVMAALIEGVGDADARRHYDWLIKTAKTYLDRNADIACAAYRAAANRVTADTVDDLIRELARADYVTTTDSAVKRANRGKAKPVLLDLLKRITGNPFNDVKIWHDWWSDNRKTWKPPDPSVDPDEEINRRDEYEDGAWGFRIRRPGPAWRFHRSVTGHPYLEIEARDGEKRGAWVEVTVVSTRNFKSKTAGAWAAEQKGLIEGKFRDVKEAQWDLPRRVDGVPGVEQVVFGQHRDHDAVYMRNLFVEKDGVMHQVTGFWKSGAPLALKDGLDAILDSYRLKP